MKTVKNVWIGIGILVGAAYLYHLVDPNFLPETPKVQTWTLNYDNQMNEPFTLYLVNAEGVHQFPVERSDKCTILCADWDIPCGKDPAGTTITLRHVDDSYFWDKTYDLLCPGGRALLTITPQGHVTFNPA